MLQGENVSGASSAVDRKSRGHTVGELQWKDPDFLCISVFSVAVMEKCCDACGDGEYYFRSGFSKLQGVNVSQATSAVDRKSRGHTVGELQWKGPDFLCISCN
jgi:hypothetical protein